MRHIITILAAIVLVAVAASDADAGRFFGRRGCSSGGCVPAGGIVVRQGQQSVGNCFGGVCYR